MFRSSVLWALAVPVAMYLYARLLRAAKAFGKKTRRLPLQALLALFAAGLSYTATQIRTIPAVVVLHIVVLSALVQFGDFVLRPLLRRIFKTRYRLWKWLIDSSLLPLALSALLLIYGYFNMFNVVPTRYTLHTDKFIRPQGYRVALISDVHFGVSLNETQLREVAARISAEQADVVVLCGDIIDSSTTKEGMEQVFSVLGSIESAYGTYYAYGNHDRPGRNQPYTQSDLTAAIEGSGIIILQDKALALTEDLTLAGRDDRGYSGKSSRLTPDALLKDADLSDFILLLDHQPYEYAQSAAAGADLILSGHTHDGQLWPIGDMQRLLRVNDLVYGHAFVGSSAQAIVTSGLAGWAYPLKTAAPAEYVIIDILPK